MTEIGMRPVQNYKWSESNEGSCICWVLSWETTEHPGQQFKTNEVFFYIWHKIYCRVHFHRLLWMSLKSIGEVMKEKLIKIPKHGGYKTL